MARVHGLEHVKRLCAAAFTHDNAIPNAVNTQMNYVVLGGNYGDQLRAGMFCTGFRSNTHMTGGIGSHADICPRLCWKYGRGY